MYYLKAKPPVGMMLNKYNYTRFGVVIPSEEIEIDTLKSFFKDSPLSEEKLLQAVRDDNRIMIETQADREARFEREKLQIESTPEYKLEEKTKKDDKKRKMQKKIDEFNEEKEKAMATEDKEDDKVVEKKEKELMKEIEEAKNESDI